jgi:hypothetical protein
VSASSSSLMKKRSNGSSSSRSTTFWTPPPSLQIFLRFPSAKVAARCLLEVSGDARDAPKLVSKNSANAIEKQSRKMILLWSLSGSSTRTSVTPIPSSIPTTNQSRGALFSFVSTSAAASENPQRASLCTRLSLNKSVDMTVATLRNGQRPSSH